jgi:hypothetical protein
MHVAELVDDVPEFAEGVAATSLDAEELRELPDCDRDPQTEQEPREHGLRDEVGHASEPQQPAAASTAAVTSASAADSAAKSPAFPPAI